MEVSEMSRAPRHGGVLHKRRLKAPGVVKSMGLQVGQHLMSEEWRAPRRIRNIGPVDITLIEIGQRLKSKMITIKTLPPDVRKVDQ
jgi:hypothetical protein